MGAEAMRSLGQHPFHVEQQKIAYKKVENQSSDKLYQAWLDDSEGERFDNNYRKLFIELEGTIKHAMSKDRSDKHNQSERAWTPPPKGYTDYIDE